MIDVITNTPRPGETQEQIAARTAPRGAPSIPYPVHIAKLAYLTQPAPGRFVLNLQSDGLLGGNARFEISRAQLGNILVDGAGMALRNCSKSTRLGPESFTPAVPDTETAALARTAAAFGEEQA